MLSRKISDVDESSSTILDTLKFAALEKHLLEKHQRNLGAMLVLEASLLLLSISAAPAAWSILEW
jgi:hypothetical protein